MRYPISFLLAMLVLSMANPSIAADRFVDEDFAVLSQSRYWIVSSRSCSQTIQRVGCCALRSWRVDCSSCATETCQPVTQYESTLTSVGAEEIHNSLIPGVPVCVLVHGSYSRWEDVLAESENSWRWLQHAAPERVVQFIAFTWPSEPLTYLPNIDANVLGKRSGVNGFYLARMMQMIPSECPVCFIGHSHGTRTISSMLHLLQGGVVEGYCLAPGSDAGHRIRAVFAASAIDHNWLNPGKRYGNALGRVDSLMNLRNRRDWVLGFYPLRTIGSSRALGRAGWTSRDYVRLGTQTSQLQELDVTCLIGKPHIWPTYYQSPALAEAISPFIHFADEPVFSDSTQKPFLDSRTDLAITK